MGFFPTRPVFETRCMVEKRLRKNLVARMDFLEVFLAFCKAMRRGGDPMQMQMVGVSSGFCRCL